MGERGWGGDDRVECNEKEKKNKILERICAKSCVLLCVYIIIIVIIKIIIIIVNKMGQNEMRKDRKRKREYNTYRSVM